MIRNGIKQLREEKGWTQGQLAKVVSISRQSINAIEGGRCEPSLSLALTLAQVFECPVDEIFWLESPDLRSGSPDTTQ